METGDPFVGSMFGDRWVIERPLTSGGMGSVYVAKHLYTGRRVALKVIKSDAAQNPEFVSRFRKETGALAAVSHPHVVTFLDSGVENGNFFLVMELLSGRPLREAMRSPVPCPLALGICIDTCRALAAVHKLGIIHRDLKPENVFLQQSEGLDEFAKLIDFGIVRLDDTSRSVATGSATKTGAIVGTPGYISPEQLRGKPASAASDMYAVGVMLYELVTGRFPFDAPSVNAMLVKQLIDPLVPPRTYVPSLPIHVEQLILRFMEKDPAARVASAKDAITLLQAAQKKSSDPSSPAPMATTEIGDSVGHALRAVHQRPTAPTPTTAPLPNLARGPPQDPTANALSLLAPSAEAPVSEGRFRGARFAVAGAGLGALAVAGFILATSVQGDAEPYLRGAQAPAPSVATEPASVSPEPSATTVPATAGAPAPPTPPPAAPSPAPGLGFVTVSATPAASVFIDGTNVGTTPLDRITTPSDSHTVKLVGKAGEVTKRIEVTAGGTVNVNHAFRPAAATPAAPLVQPPSAALTRQPPSTTVLSTFVTAQAAELLTCGGDRVPRKLALSFAPDGTVSASFASKSEPAIACAMKQVATWRIDPFDGAAVPLLVSLPLGTKKPLAQDLGGKIIPSDGP